MVYQSKSKTSQKHFCYFSGLKKDTEIFSWMQLILPQQSVSYQFKSTPDVVCKPRLSKQTDPMISVHRICFIKKIFALNIPYFIGDMSIFMSFLSSIFMSVFVRSYLQHPGNLLYASSEDLCISVSCPTFATAIFIL